MTALDTPIGGIRPDGRIADSQAGPATALCQGLRDRKKIATRQALRLAALDLVAERGYAHVTVEDIAEAADVSARTFFNYFPSKEAALVGDDPERTEELRIMLLGQPIEATPLDALRAVMRDKAALIEAEIGDGRTAWIRRCRAITCEPHLLAAQAAHSAKIERVLTEAIATRLSCDPTTDAYPAIVVAAAMAAARTAFMFWGTNGGVDSLLELTDAALESLAGGLVDKTRLAGLREAAKGNRGKTMKTRRRREATRE